ncbi:MAG: radical SAM protein [Geobacteraceae bacterium]|nr:radical SAM protein [Geobacteraceae bacterium]
MKPVIVPFFISHQGCPHDCIFCDQRLISGSYGALPTAEAICSTIAEWQGSCGARLLEIAYFGGSFTMLSKEDQISLLEPLQPFLKSAEISAVRVSTRPDGIGAESVNLLKEYGVSLVELGVQSMDDDVLRRANRGHTADDIRRAFQILHSAGIGVGAQMMPGLPGDTAEGALASFREIIGLKPDCIRIYPALVLKGTALARLYEAGEYQPLTLPDAVSLCKAMLHEAELAKIPVIRVGLQATDELTTDSQVLAGPCHPALRQLAESERWFDLLKELLGEFRRGERLQLRVSPPELSNLIGQKRTNIVRLEETFGVKILSITPDSSVVAGRVFMMSDRTGVHGDLLGDV